MSSPWCKSVEVLSGFLALTWPRLSKYTRPKPSSLPTILTRADNSRWRDKGGRMVYWRTVHLVDGCTYLVSLVAPSSRHSFAILEKALEPVVYRDISRYFETKENLASRIVVCTRSLLHSVFFHKIIPEVLICILTCVWVTQICHHAYHDGRVEDFSHSSDLEPSSSLWL